MLKVKARLYRKVSILSSVLSRKSFIITTIISLLLFTSIYADTQYDISIDNSEQVADNIYEFDVVIKSNSEAFTLTSYQVSFGFNQEIINNGEISFSYVNGTSELSNIPSVGIGLNFTDDISELTFASLPGDDIINSSYIRIGHFRLENTNSFSDVPSISFNFDGRITTILTGSSFADITSQSNHSVSGVGNKEEGNVPVDYLLSQNYPNPFNPSTNIAFELKKEAKVKLAVYNVLGEEVAELFNGEINAGAHKFEFNAVGLASGVYVYRLDAGKEFTETKKMILMR